MLLYNALVAVEFSTLFKLVDTAKQLEARHQEDREEREQQRKTAGKERKEEVRVIASTVDLVPSYVQGEKKKKKKGQYHSTPVSQVSYVVSTPMYPPGAVRIAQAPQKKQYVVLVGGFMEVSVDWGKMFAINADSMDISVEIAHDGLPNNQRLQLHRS